MVMGATVAEEVGNIEPVTVALVEVVRKGEAGVGAVEWDSGDDVNGDR